LIKELLIKDEFKRLGSRTGASEVKAHIFFKKTNWALLRNTTPPIIPYVSHSLDTSNFRSLKDDGRLDLDFQVLLDDPLESNPFHGFESVSFHRNEF
jgi:hypothetical protein